jgi:hypothetical protein
MKHLLNNLSSDEKNSIREQYEGGMSIDTSKFKKLLETKLGDAKPLINEENDVVTELERQKFVQQMIKEYIDAVYVDIKPGSDDVVLSDGTIGRLYSTNGVIDYDKVYNFKGDEINEAMVGYGFPNGLNVPENITPLEFEELKKKWEVTLKVLENKSDVEMKGDPSYGNKPTSSIIRELSDNLLMKSLENWYSGPQWKSVYKNTTGWKETMLRDQSGNRMDHPCAPPKDGSYNQDVEVTQSCKTYMKSKYEDYLNKFLVKNGFVGGYNVNAENYNEVKKLYDTLIKTNGWKK